MKKIRAITSLGVIFALLAVLVGPLMQVAHAGLTSVSVTLSTVRTAIPANHTITFTTPAGVAAGQTIVITYPAGWTIPTMAHTDLDLLVGATNLELAATPSAATWGAVVSTAARTITFTSGTGTIAAASVVTIRAGTNAVHPTAGTQQITNPAAGTHVITIGGTMANSGSAAVTIIPDDRVVVTADVTAHLTFAISDLTIGFGPLSHTATRWADHTGSGSGTSVSAHNFTASTNAASGYAVTLSGPTLTAGAHSIAAIGATAAASAIGTEQFGLRITATAGNGVPTAPYNTGNFAFTPSTVHEVAASTAPSITTTFDVFYIANITATTEAGAYSTTLTYIATARF